MSRRPKQNAAHTRVEVKVDLVRFSEHLHYEVIQLIRTARILDTKSARIDPAHAEMLDNIYNAVIESFGLHARSLLDFLYIENKSKPDDVIARDYVGIIANWEREIGKITPALQKARDRVNKEMAHLTSTRLAVTEDAKSWQFVNIMKDIIELFKIFLRQTPDANLGTEMVDLKSLLLKGELKPQRPTRSGRPGG
jgi:hypothetical protein